LQKIDCSADKPIQVFKFTVHRYAQRLESSGCRMDVPPFPFAGCARYQISEFLCGRDGFSLFSTFNDPPGDATRVSLLAVLEDDGGYFLFRESQQKFCCALLPAFRIHPHVERRIKTKTETSRRRVKLK
jgi:hypothetical protein